MPIVHKLIVIGLLFLATLATGFWASNSRRPPNPFLFTAHKLLALAAVIFIAMLIYHSAQPAESRIAFVAVIAVLGVSFVALIWTGAMLTMPKLESAVWLTLHRVGSAVAVVATVVTVRLFILNRQ